MTALEICIYKVLSTVEIEKYELTTCFCVLRLFCCVVNLQDTLLPETTEHCTLSTVAFKQLQTDFSKVFGPKGIA